MTSAGLHSGSVYWDAKANGSMEGSKVCPVNKVLIVKTHAKGNGIPKPKCGDIKTLDYRKAIFLTRNPYNSILAEFNRRHANKTTAVSRDMFYTSGKCTKVTK